MSRLDTVLRQLTLANQLTLLRLAAVPALALTLLSGATDWAFAIYILAAVTDGLDGVAARRLGQQTALGAFLDPAADKLLMLVTYVVLALPDRPRAFPEFTLHAHVPAWLTVLVIARDVVMVLISLGLYLSYGETRFTPLRIGKATTGAALLTAGAYLLANVWDGVPAQALEVLVFATSALLVASGIGYLLRTGRALRRTGGEASR